MICFSDLVLYSMCCVTIEYQIHMVFEAVRHRFNLKIGALHIKVCNAFL